MVTIVCLFSITPYYVLRALCSSVLRTPCSVLCALCSVLRAPCSVPRALLRCAASCVALRCVALRRDALRSVALLRLVALRGVALRRVMLRRVALCCVMLRRVALCCVMLRRVALCVALQGVFTLRFCAASRFFAAVLCCLAFSISFRSCVQWDQFHILVNLFVVFEYIHGKIWISLFKFNYLVQRDWELYSGNIKVVQLFSIMRRSLRILDNWFSDVRKTVQEIFVVFALDIHRRVLTLDIFRQRRIR